MGRKHFGRGENAGYHHSLILPVFSEVFFYRIIKTQYFIKELELSAGDKHCTER